MSAWTVETYKTRNNQDPVDDFINSLSVADQRKVLYEIQLLKTLGISLREPHSKPLTGYENLFELRSRCGSNIQRVFYFHYTGKTFILLHGFTKKAQKTPQAELNTALKRREDYLAQQKEKANG